MRPAAPTEAHRVRLIALVRAGLLAALVLVILPLPAFAADGDTPTDPPTEPPTVEPAAEPTPTPDPTPTPEPTPTPTPDPTPTGDPTPPPEPTPSPSPGPVIFSVLNYRSTAVIRQYTNYWCVPAATQTMWNLISGTSNGTYARQKSLYGSIHRHNRYRYPTKGNDIAGWAWALRNYTLRPYQWRSYVTRSTALAAIAATIDRTGDPVGITVNHGSHAWIVLGYKSQPLASDPTRRTILGYYVSGPMGPGSKDPWKYRYLSVAALNKVYTKYHESTRRVIWEGRYVFVGD